MQNAATDVFRSELLDRRGRLEHVVTQNPGDKRLADLLSEVDAALGRMDMGSYGLCETCHEPIEQDRLLADPLIRYCLDHLTASEQRALEQDLQLAAEIQHGLLPQRDMKLKGWEVAHHFAPLGPVSGDYCDVVLPDGPDGNGDAFFLVGDVSGKGVAASILMANLHATFRTLLGSHLPTGALMERANRLFCESTIASQYATLVCVRASANGDIEVANAGHCPVLISCGGRTQVLQSGGIPLGMFCGSAYTTERGHLNAGDVMLLYTDGVVEARNADDEEYGPERLVAMFDRLDALTRSDARRVANACVADFTSFTGTPRRHDDVTVMAVRRAE